MWVPDKGSQSLETTEFSELTILLWSIYPSAPQPQQAPPPLPLTSISPATLQYAHWNRGPSDIRQQHHFLPKTQREEEVVPPYRTITQWSYWSTHPSRAGRFPSLACPAAQPKASLSSTVLQSNARGNEKMPFGLLWQALFKHLILLFSMQKHRKPF